MPDIMSDAVVVLLLKPIKLLSNRISNQKCLMINKSTSINLRQYFSNLPKCSAVTSIRAVLSFDTAKAFDSNEFSKGYIKKDEV